MSEHSNSPSFLIIGAPRSCTTYISDNLSSHPQVFMAKGEQDYAAADMHFFDICSEVGRENFAKGVDWYLSLFDRADNDQVCGEKTADYLVDECAAELISNSLGAVKLLVVFRNPVERALSHYRHSRHRLPVNCSFRSIVDARQDVNDVKVLSAGKYYSLLQPYLKLFPQEHILLLLKDDMDQDPEKAFRKICVFLSIEDAFHFPNLFSKINAGSSSVLAHYTARIGRTLSKKFPSLYASLMHGALASISRPVVTALRGKKPISLAETESTLSGQLGRESMPYEIRQSLQEFYRDEVESLSGLMGRDLVSLWFR